VSDDSGPVMMYIRVPLATLVSGYHKACMKGKLIEWTYDPRKDEVLIEVMLAGVKV